VNRLAFIRRMALAAAACAFIDTSIPRMAFADPENTYINVTAFKRWWDRNDTPSFRRAIKYAERGGGGTVYVPPARYCLSGETRVPPNVFLSIKGSDFECRDLASHEAIFFLQGPGSRLESTRFEVL
jgi:hypothetical protein